MPKQMNGAGTRKSRPRLSETAVVTYQMPPMMVSDRGYRVEVLAEGPVICCDIPSYGSYFQVAGTEIDYIVYR